MEEKIIYKIFTIADYDREAAYFKKMHSQGWKLKKAWSLVRVSLENHSPMSPLL